MNLSLAVSHQKKNVGKSNLILCSQVRYTRISLNPTLFGQIPKYKSKKFPVFLIQFLGYFLTFLRKKFSPTKLFRHVDRALANHPFGQNGVIWGPELSPRKSGRCARVARDSLPVQGGDAQNRRRLVGRVNHDPSWVSALSVTSVHLCKKR